MHQNNRNGFMLIEFLIYLLIGSILTGILVVGMAQLWRCTISVYAKHTIALNLAMAHDTLLQDIRSAPAQRVQWKLIEPECIIWRTGSVDRGWQREQNQLVRREGRYHAKKGIWSSCTKNMVAHSIHQFFCSVQGTPEISAVQFQIRSENIQIIGAAVPQCRKVCV